VAEHVRAVRAPSEAFRPHPEVCKQSRMIPLDCAFLCTAWVLSGVLNVSRAPHRHAHLKGDVPWFPSDAIVDAIVGVAILLPFIASIWMAISVVRGGRRVLPILGRFTDEIIATKGRDAGQPDAAATPDDRILGGSAYLSSLTSCLWFLSPLLLYFWKGRKSRFIGFHAVQALLVDAALLPAMGVIFLVLIKLFLVLVLEASGREPQTLAFFALFTTFVATFYLPFIVNIWLGVRVMRGRPGVLFMLGRLARWFVPRNAPASSP
jgi:uncharacterized membrane protein